MTDLQASELQRSVMPSVTIYSDGSYKPDLNTGGYGTIMVCNGYVRFIYGGYIGTSNNAMELQSVISALRLLKCPCNVQIISDSKYVVDGINGWMTGWAANNWRRSDGSPVKNTALWQEMYHFAQYHLLYATWIRGHAGNYNNMTCDHLACIGAYEAANLPVPPRLIDPKRL